MNAQLQPLSPTRGYVGGGNIAGILGLSPFKSPLDEYLTITNELPVEISPAKRKFFDRRKALEPFAAECFTQATGLQIVRRNEHYDDAEFDWMKAEIDFETDDGGNGETKTVHRLGFAVATVVGLEVDLGLHPVELGVVVVLVPAHDLQAGCLGEALCGERFQRLATVEELALGRRDLHRQFVRDREVLVQRRLERRQAKDAGYISAADVAAGRAQRLQLGVHAASAGFIAK